MSADPIIVVMDKNSDSITLSLRDDFQGEKGGVYLVQVRRVEGIKINLAEDKDLISQYLVHIPKKKT